MSYPSVKTLRRLFRPEDQRKAAKLRRLIDGRLDPWAFDSVQRWDAQCYHRPSRQEAIMCAADELLGTHGVEAIFGPDSVTEPYLSYCNAGDTYDLTLVYLHDDDRYVVSSWGDEIERAESRGMTFQ